MERPSHSIKTLSLQSGARRVLGVGLAVIAQFALGAVFVGGLVIQVAIKTPTPLQMRDVKNVEQRTPPPPIRIEKPVLPAAVMPQIDIAPDPVNPGITVLTQQRPEAPPVVTRQTPPPALVPDRAASAIAQTHTAPPYPVLARRLGAQGKVMLRLTVLPDGAVGKAEVVGSSGRPDLDQAAAQWITGHWTYRPAIRDGAPAVAQVLAAVQFSLSDAR